MKEPPSGIALRRRNRGRKTVARGLPPLGWVWKGTHQFSESQNKRDLLEKAMRTVIAQLQVHERMPFYPMRTVADFFQVSLQTASFVYRNLQRDGLITMVRGSQTFVEVRRVQSNVALRGVIGIPIYSPSFVVGPQPRGFYIDLEERLRLHGYLVDFIFFHDIHPSNEDVIERILRHKMDAIFWPGPPSWAKECLLRIQDLGVKLVVWDQGQEPRPGRRYYTDFQPAIIELARCWNQRGIRRVYLIGSRQEQNINQQLSAHFPAENIEVEWLDCPPERMRGLARSHSAREGYIFLGYRHYEALCNYHWEAMRKIFKTRSCLLAQGPVFHHGFQTEPVRVDVMTVPFAAMVKKIVDDFVSRAAFDEKQLDVFQTEFRADFDLSTLREGI